LVGVQASTLDVVRVAQPQSGRAKCPYDPTSVYAFVYSGKQLKFLRLLQRSMQETKLTLNAETTAYEYQDEYEHSS